MKLLAFVDLHGSKRAYDSIRKLIRKEKPNFLICAGDFTTFEHDVKHFMDMLAKLDGMIFLVHGNHEEEGVVRRIAEHYKNMMFLHGEVTEYKGIVLVGWGGGGFTIRDEEFEVWVRGIRKELRQYKKEGKKIVFVTHAPFYKTNLDRLYDMHRGNKSFTRFIREFDVDIAICGHLHENAGEEDFIGNAKVYNPGPMGKIIYLY